jgi:hypothetical protein
MKHQPTNQMEGWVLVVTAAAICHPLQNIWRSNEIMIVRLFADKKKRMKRLR